MSIMNRVYFTGTLMLIAYARLAVLDSVDIELVTDELNDKLSLCKTPRVAILVSPTIDKFLQLYWDVEYVKEGDWIGLFKRDPRRNRKALPIYKITVQDPTGYHVTDIASNNEIKFGQGLKFKSECLQFWVAYFTNDGTVTVASCLKTNPTWMSNMEHQLENVQIKQMFLPGTHDSGAYVTSSEVDIVSRYVYTQDEPIIHQLIHGIRYLDIRVSYNGDTKELWWLNHGVVEIRPLQHLLNDIKLFLRNTREIVILDFHGFPVGFEDNLNTHREFVVYLIAELSKWMAPPNWDSTCGHLWELNKTLIVSYNNETIVKEYPTLLWNAVEQKWANTRDIDKLKKYFTKVFKTPPRHYGWAAMAEFTASPWSILTGQTKGLREMACDVNFQVTNWFRDIWGRTCNVVAVDFFRGTDIVYTAIDWNIRRYGKDGCSFK